MKLFLLPYTNAKNTLTFIQCFNSYISIAFRNLNPNLFSMHRLSTLSLKHWNKIIFATGNQTMKLFFLPYINAKNILTFLQCFNSYTSILFRNLNPNLFSMNRLSTFSLQNWNDIIFATGNQSMKLFLLPYINAKNTLTFLQCFKSYITIAFRNLNPNILSMHRLSTLSLQHWNIIIFATGNQSMKLFFLPYINAKKT